MQIAYSKKTKDYWHQIKVMTYKLHKLAANGVINRDEIDTVIDVLEELKEKAITA